MLSLTTAQRDLLQILLNAHAPIGAAALGQQLQLTPRQVSYGLRDIRDWLDRHQAALRQAPGVGVQIICTAAQRERLLAELASQSRFQLILTPEQREQLLACWLLLSDEPLTLGQLQQDLAVARTTVLKDLEALEPWLVRMGLRLARRQNRGCWLEGGELTQRQALLALLWGDVSASRSILQVERKDGLSFMFAQDAALLPIVDHVNRFVQQCDLATARAHIVWAETALNTRFTDEGLQVLALALALQNQRITSGHTLHWDGGTQRWLEAQVVWPAALQLAARCWPELDAPQRAAEAGGIALQLLCGARDEPWALEHDQVANALITVLLERIAAAYALPELRSDELLRAGLEVLIPPAYVRQRFAMWTPPRPISETHTERYRDERRVAGQVAEDIFAATGTPLPPDACDDLILLLRAAVLRSQPERSRHALVVCPSGMATTQLLVARLRARFPRLGTFEVLPMRELTAERLADADLVITTVPLTLAATMPRVDVIHVHPMLKPEDIAALTQWMA